MIKDRSVLSLLGNQDKDTLVEETLGIANLDDTSHYIASAEDALLIIKASDAFVKKYHNPGTLQADFFYVHARALFDDLDLCQLEQEKEKLPTFPWFLTSRFSEQKVSSTLLCLRSSVLYVLPTTMQRKT